jgi:hypothetical protein
MTMNTSPHTYLALAQAHQTDLRTEATTRRLARRLRAEKRAARRTARYVSPAVDL